MSSTHKFDRGLIKEKKGKLRNGKCQNPIMNGLLKMAFHWNFFDWTAQQFILFGLYVLELPVLNQKLSFLVMLSVQVFAHVQIVLIHAHSSTNWK